MKIALYKVKDNLMKHPHIALGNHFTVLHLFRVAHLVGAQHHHKCHKPTRLIYIIPLPLESNMVHLEVATVAASQRQG